MPFDQQESSCAPEAAAAPCSRAGELLREGRAADASTLLAEAIAQNESADLWNDWAVVQLSLAERALRRALEMGGAHAEAAANLGVVLFSIGKRGEAAPLLREALGTATGSGREHLETLLGLCASGAQAAHTEFACCAGKTALVQHGANIGRPRGGAQHQAWRCKSCGYMCFDPPADQFLAEYYRGEYPRNAAPWYNAENDYEPGRCQARAEDVLGYARKYVGSARPLLHECGCSFGGTVAKLRSLGFAATGTELNEAAVREGSRRGNQWIFAEYEGDFFRRTNSDFHVVYLYHALEHMPYPLEFLADVKAAIAKDGVLFVAVPNAINYFSLSKGFTENPWFAYPDHLHYFSAGVLPCLARAAGYAVLEVETRMVAATQEDAERALPFRPGSAEWQLAEKMIHRALMGQELRFVLTPLESSIANRFASQIRAAQAICEHARGQEAALLEFSAQ